MGKLAIAALCVTVWADTALACSIPLQPTRTAFVATVRIGSEGPLRFLVDTGATTTVIDRVVARRIGLQPSRVLSAITTTGQLDVQVGVVDELSAGTVSAVRALVLVTDLPSFPHHGHLDGILGMNFFAGHSVRFDIGRRCVELDVEPPLGVALEAHEVAGRVAAEIEGLNFVVDSGASFPVLMSPAARALGSQDGAVEITSAGGRRLLTAATIPRLRIGGMTFRDVAVVLAPARDHREDGLLPITLFESIYFAADRKIVVIR